MVGSSLQIFFQLWKFIRQSRIEFCQTSTTKSICKSVWSTLLDDQVNGALCWWSSTRVVSQCFGESVPFLRISWNPGTQLSSVAPGKRNVTRVAFQEFDIRYRMLWDYNFANSTIAQWLAQQSATEKARDRFPTRQVVKELLLRNHRRANVKQRQTNEVIL